MRMVAEIRAEHESEWAAMTRVSELLGVGTPETVRKWVRRSQVDAGCPAGYHDRGVGRGPPAEAGERRAAPRQRDPEGRGGFLRSRARPALPLIVDFIRDHADHREDPVACAGVSSRSAPC